MKWTLALLIFASASSFAADDKPAAEVATPDKPINFNVLPPKHEKKKKSNAVRKLTPMSVVCDVDGSSWATKNREDEDRCKMRGGKLRVAAGDGHQLPDMQSIPSKNHPTRMYPPQNIDPVNQNPHLQTDPAAPVDGTN